jgi:CRP-like cAMP-binding protein
VPNIPVLFSGLSEIDQRGLVAAGQPRLLKPRELLGRQGEPASLFALVQIGHLKLGQVNQAGVETLVRFIGPGDCYGAIALVSGSRYPVSATAVEPSRVLAWPRPVIVELAERLPRLKSNIFEEVTRWPTIPGCTCITAACRRCCSTSRWASTASSSSRPARDTTPMANRCGDMPWSSPSST